MQAEKKEFVYILIQNNDTVKISGRFEADNITRDNELYVIKTPIGNLHISSSFVYKHEYEISDNDYGDKNNPLGLISELRKQRPPSVIELAAKN